MWVATKALEERLPALRAPPALNPNQPNHRMAVRRSQQAWHGCYRQYAQEQSAEDQGRHECAEREVKVKRIGLLQDENPVPPQEYGDRGK
jgi:hypothetical protein